MSRIPIDELRRLGITSEDIDMARTTQEAQRRNGSPVQSIAVLVGATQARQRPTPNPPVDLTDRALRRRGDELLRVERRAHPRLAQPVDERDRGSAREGRRTRLDRHGVPGGVADAVGRGEQRPVGPKRAERVTDLRRALGGVAHVATTARVSSATSVSALSTSRILRPRLSTTKRSHT